MKLPQRLPAELRAFIGEIEFSLELARDPQRSQASAPKISGWSVAQHLEHLATADSMILQGLHQAAAGEGSTSEAGPTAVGRVILFLGVIPRGKGQAPQETRPTGLKSDAIAAELERVGASAKDLQSVSDNLRRSTARARHFAFGFLNAYQWIRVGHIHHLHHRRIITDILRNDQH
jgi:hypothetical protein